jgi:PEGA domain
MKCKLVLPVLLLCMCQIVWASAKEQDYTASKQAVFNAAVKVIQKDWNITFMDRESGIISFKTGTSVRSYGMECQVSVIEVSASQTKLRVGAQKTGGQLVAWGAGGSIASKVFKGVEDELNSSAHAAVTASAPAAAPTQPASGTPTQLASVALNQTASVAPIQPASSPSVQQATVEFWSSPAGADIEVDGKYIGSTPSTVTVQAGEHTITMRKQDFGTWQKTIKVTSGNLRVAAYMQQVGITFH